MNIFGCCYGVDEPLIDGLEPESGSHCGGAACHDKLDSVRTACQIGLQRGQSLLEIGDFEALDYAPWLTWRSRRDGRNILGDPMDWADAEAVVAAGCKRVDGASAQGLFDQNPP